MTSTVQIRNREAKIVILAKYNVAILAWEVKKRSFCDAVVWQCEANSFQQFHYMLSWRKIVCNVRYSTIKVRDN